MNLTAMEKRDCNMCKQKAAFVEKVIVRTLSNEVREVEVTRCANCDTIPCPKCKERTMIASQRDCKRCGTPYLPRPR